MGAGRLGELREEWQEVVDRCPGRVRPRVAVARLYGNKIYINRGLTQPVDSRLPDDQRLAQEN